MWMFLLILSSLFSKHVNLHTKNNTIVHIGIYVPRTPAIGVWDHVSCKHLKKLEYFGVLMHILKTFVLIHLCFCLLINTDIE